MGGGFAAPAAGGGGEKGKEEKLQKPDGMPGHGPPSGPIDKLHGGESFFLKCFFNFDFFATLDHRQSVT